MKALIAALMFVCASGVWAQGKPLACETDARAGLSWENKQWVVLPFVKKRFVLVMDGKNLTNNSVAKALRADANFLKCTVGYARQVSCHDDSGAYMLFDPSTNKGGYSVVFGALKEDSSSSKDTVTVSAFTCQPF